MSITMVFQVNKYFTDTAVLYLWIHVAENHRAGLFINDEDI